MNVISEPAIKRLEQLARVGEAITTRQVREVLGISRLVLHGMTLHPAFPKRQQIGKNFWVNPERLLAFAHSWNKQAAGVPITAVAHLLHATVPTARKLVRRDDFPKPIGDMNGRKVWDPAEIAAWHGPRVEGAKLPAGADIAPRKTVKKKVATAKGTRHGKAKEKPRAEVR